uniref:Terpene synthase metal-binding domain-containing protein n=1 Tax=Oryza meridionalis TaxID=40149 RepID=A0A0E0CM98_9ORYZ
MEKWDKPHQQEFYSEDVKLLFQALCTTWLDMLRCMMTEAEWQRSQYVPTFEEYMECGVTSLTHGATVISGMFFIGVKLTDDIIKHQEYNEVFRLVGTCSRLLNDIRGIEREAMDGKLTNGVSLVALVVACRYKRLKWKRVDTARRKLLKLVLREGAIPRPCKQLFWNWKMCKNLHLFYYRTDGFSSPKMVSAVNAIIKEPLELGR